MSRKPFFTLILASSLILGITQPTHARVAPTAYLCALGAAPPCSCTGELVFTNEPSLSLDLCLGVGPTSSEDPAASCSPAAGNGDEICGWEIELRAVGGFTISNFVPNGEENLASSTIQASTLLRINWMFRVSNNEPGPPLDNKGPQRIGVIYLSNPSGALGKLRVTAESRAAHVGGGEVAIDPRVLLMPEPSRGALLLLGIATLWVLSRGGRRRASSLLLVPLLLASPAPAARADHLPLLDPETPSAPVFAGVALAALEDVNGDRVADLGIGLPDADAGRGQVVLQLFRRDGSLHGTLLIGQGQGGFGGSLAAGANFGAALASPGDLDGDGLSELAVAAPGAGELWILFIDSGPPVRVSAQQSIPLGEAVYALAALGDLNGDTVPDLAAGHPFADTGCTQDCGAVSLLSLASDGSLSGLLATLQNGSPNLPALVDDMRFGSSLAALGDLDSDGSLELAVGAVGGGASAKGSVELVSLDAIGSVLAHAVIDASSAGFSCNGDTEIGAALVALEDLDASGGSDLAVGCPGPPGTGQGRVTLLALGTPPGSILDSASIDAITAPPDAVAAGTNFGRALAALDIDADGDPELAVGALSDASLVYPDPIWLLALGDADDDRRPNFLDNCERPCP